MTATTDRFEALRIERADDGELLLTCPDQTGNGDAVILLHPAQARRIGELAGMAGMADNGEAQRELARLRRRLLMIDSQAERLARWLCEFSDSAHGDLSVSAVMANILADLTADAVGDFGSDTAGRPAPVPMPPSAAPPPAAPPPACAAAQGVLL